MDMMKLLQEFMLTPAPSGYESEMRLTHYSDFLKWKSRLDESGTEEIYDIDTIEFKDVSFAYQKTLLLLHLRGDRYLRQAYRVRL